MRVEDKVTSEAIMSEKVKTALLRGRMKSPDGRRLRCDVALREFDFKRGVYDVVGYDKQENTIYIVECKLGDNLTSIGQAFGQILSYKSILTENGYDFLMKFYKKYSEDVQTKGYMKIDLEHWRQILDRRKMNFRFFVALKEQSRKLHREIIRIRDNINFKIGLLVVTKTGVCTPLAESEKIEVPLIKKYANRFDFLESLERKLKDKLPFQYRDFKSYSRKSYKQFILCPKMHYEILFTRGKRVEIALHIETNKETTERLFSFLLERERQIKSSLGASVKIEKWGKGWVTGKGVYWARVFEIIPLKDLDENFLEEVSERLKEYIVSLQPILEQIK